MRIEKLTETEREMLKTAGIESLIAAKKVHDTLGEDGLTPVPSPNQFGEQALKVDVEAENAVLNTLSAFKMPMRVISEEHGTIDITANPKYLGILDGIDGTANYRSGRNTLRYATMLGIYPGLDPTYSGYFFSGMMEHTTNKLWYAVSGKGSIVCDLNSYKQKLVKTSNVKEFTSDCVIYTALSYSETPIGKRLIEFLEPYNTSEPKSAAISYLDLASGIADLQVEITRKGNLEQGVAYGFIAEAGGVMVDRNNRSIGNQKWLEWGQGEHILLITASTAELASDFQKKFELA